MGHEGCALWVHRGLCSSAWKCCTCWERGKSSFPWGAVLRAAAPRPPSSPSFGVGAGAAAVWGAPGTPGWHSQAACAAKLQQHSRERSCKMSWQKKSIPGAGQQGALAGGDVPGQGGLCWGPGLAGTRALPWEQQTAQARARAAGCGHRASKAGGFGLPEPLGVVLSLRLPPLLHSDGCRCARLTTRMGAAAVTQIPMNSSTAPIKRSVPFVSLLLSQIALCTKKHNSCSSPASERLRLRLRVPFVGVSSAGWRSGAARGTVPFRSEQQVGGVP